MKETTTPQALAISPATGQLLNALRALYTAQTHYYAAFEALADERAATEQLKATAPVWDAAADLIEHGIIDAVRTWAALTPDTNKI